MRCAQRVKSGRESDELVRKKHAKIIDEAFRGETAA
jgi:hypothetical protein